MSSSTTPRIKRGPPPEKPIKRRRYHDALPDLIRDFAGRCAYSMQHQARCGQLEVDHFDPRCKSDLIQDYENLFPASRFCNGKKSDNWPTKTEEKAGCRFLNPCKEMDYGEQVFEDTRTHLLVGVTPAARWHIRICGLNAGHLVEERMRRAECWAALDNTPVRIIGDFAALRDIVGKFRAEVELMIPPIAAPPVSSLMQPSD